MICKQCKKEFKPDNPKTHNAKFCSVACREKYYYWNYRKQYQEDRQNKRAEKPNSNKIRCKICGRYYTQLLSHCWQKHEMSAREYKEAFGYDVKRGLIKEPYREVKRETQDPKTLENLKKGERYWFVKGDKQAGRYKRSPQTMERLKKQFINIKKK